MNALKRNCPYPFLEKWSSSLCRLESPTVCHYRGTIMWMWLGIFQLGRLLPKFHCFFPLLLFFFISFSCVVRLLPPTIPEFSLMPHLLADSFAVAIVGFSMGISLSKIFALKHGYSVDGNQVSECV